MKKTRDIQANAERRAARFINANCGTLSRICENMPEQEIGRLHGLIDRAIRTGWNAAVYAAQRDRQSYR